ncbi:MAG: AEC family transporter [Coprococcus sp.]|nr:AEC family transporter [Coprococcus sp.]
MQIFFTTFNQMLILFLCIIAGYILTKTKVLPDNSANILAKLENYLLIPCLILNTFIEKSSINNLSHHISTLTAALIVLMITIAISLFASSALTTDHYQKNLFRYSLITPNYNFMGNALALGIFGIDFLFEYMIYNIPLTIFTYTIGISWLKNEQSGIKLSSLINPISISMILGLILGLVTIPLPTFFISTVSSFGSCMSPIAMLLTGMIIGHYRLGSLINNPKIYIISGIRLVVIPIIFLLLFKVTGLGQSAMPLAICTLAMPLGLNTIIIPAAYGQDTSVGASMTLISSILSLITIPVIFALI